MTTAFKAYLDLTHEEAARAQSVLMDMLHGQDPAALIPRLAVSSDGAVGMALKRPRLYDPARRPTAPSGRPWLKGPEQAPSDGEWLATDLVFYPLAEALELLADPQRSPEAEVENRRRDYNQRQAVARQAEESAARLHNEDVARNRALQARWQELGGEVWDRELGGVFKLAFRLEAAFRKHGFAALADEVREVALEGLKSTSKARGGHVQMTEPRHMYLDGPQMLLEEWLP